MCNKGLDMEIKDLYRRAVDDKVRENRVYVYRFMLNDDRVIFKVGVSSHSNMVDRLLEVQRSFFQAYRYIMMADCRKYAKVDDAYGMERSIHKVLDNYKTKWDKKFDGMNEMFECDEDLVIRVFEEHLDKYTGLPDWIDSTKAQ